MASNIQHGWWCCCASRSCTLLQKRSQTQQSSNSRHSTLPEKMGAGDKKNPEGNKNKKEVKEKERRGEADIFNWAALLSRAAGVGQVTAPILAILLAGHVVTPTVRAKGAWATGRCWVVPWCGERWCGEVHYGMTWVLPRVGCAVEEDMWRW